MKHPIIDELAVLRSFGRTGNAGRSIWIGRTGSAQVEPSFSPGSAQVLPTRSKAQRRSPQDQPRPCLASAWVEPSFSLGWGLAQRVLSPGSVQALPRTRSTKAQPRLSLGSAQALPRARSTRPSNVRKTHLSAQTHTLACQPELTHQSVRTHTYEPRPAPQPRQKPRRQKPRHAPRRRHRGEEPRTNRGQTAARTADKPRHTAWKKADGSTL